MHDRFRFRYVFKDDGGVTRIEHYSIEDIENSALSWLHLKGQTWKLLSRDQCTGLKDKNGKLIYEGDIVRSSWCGVRDVVYEVIFDTGDLSWSMYNDMAQESLFLAECEGTTILGNIHENPELLEQPCS